MYVDCANECFFLLYSCCIPRKLLFASTLRSIHVSVVGFHAGLAIEKEQEGKPPFVLVIEFACKGRALVYKINIWVRSCWTSSSTCAYVHVQQKMHRKRRKTKTRREIINEAFSQRQKATATRLLLKQIY